METEPVSLPSTFSTMAKTKPTKKAKPTAATPSTAPKQTGTTKGKSDSFLQEIKDLGGDEDDWKMLQGIDGDEVHEEEGGEVFDGEAQVDVSGFSLPFVCFRTEGTKLTMFFLVVHRPNCPRSFLLS